MSKYQKYPEYKDSYTPWLGNVPEHWTSIKFKQAFIHKTKTSNSKLDCGSISFGNVVYKDNEKIPEETRAAYQEVLAGEFLINPLNLNFDLKSLRTALSTLNVAVSTGYIVLQSKPNLNKNYLRWLLFQFDVAHMKTLGAGVRQTVSFTDIGNEYFQMPPFQEQQTIANHLDKATAKIDTLIEKQTKLIELLKEKRQAVISTAVTRGLDSSVPMKDSGVEWLGEIPENWTISRLKYHVNTVNGFGFSSSDFQDNGIPFIRAGNIKKGTIVPTDIFLPVSLVEKYKRVILREGDIVISMVGSDPKILKSAVGQVAEIPAYMNGAVPNQNIVILKEKKRKLTKNFLLYTLKSTSYRNHLNVYSHKLANQSIISSSLIVAAYFLSPSIEEQQIITDYLDDKTSKIDTLITKATKAIELLKERRTALISAVVTGKIDVRETA